MDFRFTGDEREIIDQAGRALRKYLPAARVVAAEQVADGWRSLAHEGWLHAGLPASLGGGDLPLVIVAAIGREAGTVLAGDAYVDNAVILPRLVGGGESPGWCESLLTHPGFVTIPPRLDEPADAYGVEPGLSVYRVAGGRVARFAPDAWTFAAQGKLGLTTGTVRIHEGATPEVWSSTVDDLGGILRDAAIVHAAALVGLGHKALTDTVEHVKTRAQFGGPIGRFQAVKHMLADVSVGLEVAWNAVAFAALRPSPDSVSIACLQAGRAADQAARTMIQLFGGMAMTWEHHAHWYVKVIQTSRRRFGSTARHALDLADLFTFGSVA